MIKNWIFSIITLLALSGCTGEACVEADDFGHAHFTVSARYDKDEFKSNQPMSNQIAPWRNSHYAVNGKPLTIAVKAWDSKLDYNLPNDLSAWCAWYGHRRNKATLSKICERLPECKFDSDKGMCPNDPTISEAQITNAPCIFKNGVGLYALIATKGSNPNQTLSSQLDPSGINFHVGDPNTDYTLYDVNRKGKTIEIGGKVFNFDADQKEKYANSKLYFKILDKFYHDNNGQYRVIIKSGITQSSPDPISYTTKLVKDFLYNDNYGVIRNIYSRLVKEPGYQLAVSAMLTLYVMFTALSYLSGNLQITHTELIIRVIKIAIISVLLNTELSWTFFNDYLFVYFIGGMDQILQMIMEAGASGPGSTSILGMMLAPQTLSKLFALLFIDSMGWLYIILFTISLYFIIIVFFEGAVIYLTALIVIGVIITLGPIFICFMLFNVTKPLFENWLKQLIGYSVQPILLFTGLVFISMILRQEIYGSLGFKVCKHSFPKLTKGGKKIISNFSANVTNEGAADSLFYWWFPEPMKASKFTKTMAMIPVPVDHFVSNSASSNPNNIINTLPGTEFCEAYGCVENRYIELPFLDPEKDHRRLNHFWNGKFVQMDGMLLIFAAIYLLHKFNNFAVSTASVLTGTSGNFTDIGKVGDIATYQFASEVMSRKGISNARAIASGTLAGARYAARKTYGAASYVSRKTGATYAAGKTYGALGYIARKTPSATFKIVRSTTLATYGALSYIPKKATNKLWIASTTEAEREDFKNLQNNLQNKATQLKNNATDAIKENKDYAQKKALETKNYAQEKALETKDYVKDNSIKAGSFVKNAAGIAALGAASPVILTAKGVAEVGKLSAKAIQAGAENIGIDTADLSDKAKNLTNIAKESLTLGPNKAVLKKIELKHGLKQEDFQKNAGLEYRKQLVMKLQQLDESLAKSDAEKIAKQMSRKKPGSMDNEFAKAKYGKKLADLSKDEKLSIEALNNKELRTIARHAEKEKQFQKIYAETYNEMGLLDRNSSRLRNKTEARNKKLEEQELKTKKKDLLKEQMSATFGDMLRGTPLGSGPPHGIDPRDDNHRKETKSEILQRDRDELQRQELQARIEKLSREEGERITTPESIARARIKQNKLDHARKADQDLFNALGNKATAGLSSKTYDSVKSVSNALSRGATSAYDSAKETTSKIGESAKGLANTTYEKSISENNRNVLEKQLKGTKEKGSKIASSFYQQIDDRVGMMGLSSTQTHEELARAEIRSEVNERLNNITHENKPMMMGDTYMSKLAKDEEMTSMIDSARALEQEMISSMDDKHRDTQEKYEAMEQSAEERVQSYYNTAYSILEKNKDLDMETVTIDQMPDLLKKAYAESTMDKLNPNTNHGKKWNNDMAVSTAKELEKALEDHALSQEVLQEIDKNKAEIANAIDGQIDNINQHRKDRGMDEYQPEKEIVTVRPMRKIEDRIKKK